MTLKDNATATIMGLVGILFPAILIQHATGYAAPVISFLAVVIACFTGIVFGYWNSTNNEPLDSEGNPMPVCRACEAVYPEPHDYDCAEAQG